ncbi:translocon subunit Sec61 [Schizosaccharomyces japonicus yFS275]|uniref:Translocon subunit Sec61 n=1 Tax=Schizosaccharomyces japonicus (strain yFS275 / FY16936) TaxID=402676 RepID=B6K1U7_SCHJY|nr:translocon subunit Sec61 [Schizosaccharomyces japonicus yFS275]EEB07128.2 translocon subunit Sec61 [Schizosaccharomyces japonicus yFS275]
MSDHRFIKMADSLAFAMPEVERPRTRIDFYTKLAWMAGCAALYHVMSCVPVFGAKISDKPDPLFSWRALDGSNKSALTINGLAPVFLSAYILQLLAGAGKLKVNFFLKNDRLLFQNAQKFLSVVLYFLLSVAYMASGFFGTFAELGLFKYAVVFLQIFLAGVVSTYLCEVVEKGYGLGSGPSLLLASHILGAVWWQTMGVSRYTYNAEGSLQYEGALVGIALNLFTFKEKFAPLREVFFRPERLSVYGFLICVATYFSMAYLINMRIDVPIRSSRVRGHRQNFPLRLLYTSVMPLVFLISILSHVQVFAYAIHSLFPNALLTRLLVQYAESDVYARKELRLVGGLVYYLIPTCGLKQTLLSPLRVTVSSLYAFAVTIPFSRAWMNATGAGPRDVLRFFKENALVMAGYREASMLKELNRILPTAAWVSAFTITSLALVSSAISSTTLAPAVVVGAGLTFATFELIMGENPQMLPPTAS